jgi:hypothetical protein
MSAGNPEMLIGWIFRREAVYEYPEYPEIYSPADNLAIRLPAMLAPGDWQVTFFDTLTGGELGTFRFRRWHNSTQVMPIPPFRLDIAFKLRRIKGESE